MSPPVNPDVHHRFGSLPDGFGCTMLCGGGLAALRGPPRRGDDNRGGLCDRLAVAGRILSRIGAPTGTFILPPSVDGLGVGITMLFAAAICIIGAVVSQFLAPETRGLSLSEASAPFGKAAGSQPSS